MKKAMGTTIAELRRSKGMTQLELAEKMGVTDKAVSKWERDLSCPDTASLPQLAEILGVSLDQLMKGDPLSAARRQETLADLILRAAALAMGVAVVVTNLLGSLTTDSAVTMLGVGLTCLGIWALRRP